MEVDFKEIIKVQYERGVYQQFDSFVRNGWGKIILDYINKKDSQCLNSTGHTYFDPETKVISCIKVCGDKIMIRFIPGSTEFRFAEGEELFCIPHQYNEVYIEASELL